MDWRLAAVKLREHGCDRHDVTLLRRIRGQHAVKHSVPRQADHLDQPVDDTPLPAKAQRPSASSVRATMPR